MEGTTYDTVQVFHPPRRARVLGDPVGFVQAPLHVTADHFESVLGLAESPSAEGGQV